jgi:hypothetical protein
VDALQHGGPGGNPRPIEVYAHDPIRYIGDMLAWIHQAACSERETLDQLLDEVDGSCTLYESFISVILFSSIALNIFDVRNGWDKTM